MKRLLAVIALLVMAALPLVLIGCGGDSAPNPPLFPMTITYSVTMTNSSTEDTHMFITGEGFDASNKLPPNGRRTKTISFTYNSATETANLVVSAGRNGTVLVNRTIVLSPTSAITYQVEFNGTAIVVP